MVGQIAATAAKAPEIGCDIDFFLALISLETPSVSRG
jgi:hypothetical protein